MMHNVLLYPVG